MYFLILLIKNVREFVRGIFYLLEYDMWGLAIFNLIDETRVRNNMLRVGISSPIWCDEKKIFLKDSKST